MRTQCVESTNCALVPNRKTAIAAVRARVARRAQSQRTSRVSSPAVALTARAAAIDGPPATANTPATSQ